MKTNDQIIADAERALDLAREAVKQRQMELKAARANVQEKRRKAAADAGIALWERLSKRGCMDFDKAEAEKIYAFLEEGGYFETAEEDEAGRVGEADVPVEPEE